MSQIGFDSDDLIPPVPNIPVTINITEISHSGLVDVTEDELELLQIFRNAVDEGLPPAEREKRRKEVHALMMCELHKALERAEIRMKAIRGAAPN